MPTPRVAIPRWDSLIVVMLGALVISHYAVPAHVLWVHMVLFSLFQVPILIGGATRGIRGGIATATVASLLLLPHAVGLSRHHGLSANTIWMDLASLFIIGLVTGWLRDRWRREQEMGERMRDLKSLDRILDALREDLRGPVPAMRGLLLSMEPLQTRVPALMPAVRAMDRSLASVETLVARLQILRLDSRMSLTRLDRILTEAQAQLDRLPEPAPRITLDWRCPPPRLPASVAAIGSSIATFALHITPPTSEVQITISRRPRWAVLDMRPRGEVWDNGAAPREAPLASLEMATQVIRAHGGHVENRLADAEKPHLRVYMPSILRVRISPHVLAADANGGEVARDNPSPRRDPRPPRGKSIERPIEGGALGRIRPFPVARRIHD